MKTKVPNLITILVLTVLTAVVWISLGVYRAITTQPTPRVPEEISQPLSPILDKNVIDDIKSRQFVSPNEIPTTLIIIPTSTPTIAATVTASPSATLASSPTSTPIPTASSEGVTP